MHCAKKPEIAPRVTLAFHFQFIMPGEWVDQFELATGLFMRVLKVVRPDAIAAGSLLFRMGHLLSAADIHAPAEFLLRQSIASAHSDRFIAGRQKSPKHFDVAPDRIWVVILSGHIEPFQAAWSSRLRRYAKHPFLFSLAVDLSEAAQEHSYLANSTVLGELHPDWSFTAAFSAVEFEPHLQKSLGRVNVNHCWSNVARETGIQLLGR